MMVEKYNGYDFFFFRAVLAQSNTQYGALNIAPSESQLFWLCVSACDYLLENGLIP